MLSLQASYAAPLILLAQNRQEGRDRLHAETDRSVAERTQADTEFLAREIAGVRLSLADMVTGETLDDRLEKPHNGDRAVERSGGVADHFRVGRAGDHVVDQLHGERRELTRLLPRRTVVGGQLDGPCAEGGRESPLLRGAGRGGRVS